MSPVPQMYDETGFMRSPVGSPNPASPGGDTQQVIQQVIDAHGLSGLVSPVMLQREIAEAADISNDQLDTAMNQRAFVNHMNG